MYVICKDIIYKYTQFVDGEIPDRLEFNNIDAFSIISLNENANVIFVADKNIIYYCDNSNIIKNFKIDDGFDIT
jgi:hypothetical protein